MVAGEISEMMQKKQSKATLFCLLGLGIHTVVYFMFPNLQEWYIQVDSSTNTNPQSSLAIIRNYIKPGMKISEIENALRCSGQDVI